jgi:hypothetical protein
MGFVKGNFRSMLAKFEPHIFRNVRVMMVERF